MQPFHPSLKCIKDEFGFSTSVDKIEHLFYIFYKDGWQSLAFVRLQCRRGGAPFMGVGTPPNGYRKEGYSAGK